MSTRIAAKHAWDKGHMWAQVGRRLTKVTMLSGSIVRVWGALESVLARYEGILSKSDRTMRVVRVAFGDSTSLIGESRRPCFACMRELPVLTGVLYAQGPSACCLHAHGSTCSLCTRLACVGHASFAGGFCARCSYAHGESYFCCLLLVFMRQNLLAVQIGSALFAHVLHMAEHVPGSTQGLLSSISSCVVASPSLATPLML
jgi:hypothetical protein